MISKKCLYALKAVLALARHQGAGPMTIQQIADAQEIPARFLEAILRDLKQNGFTESIRGKEGGYILARPAHEICMGDIIHCLEGPWYTPGPGTDVFSEVWEKADSVLSEVVNQIDFQTLLRREDELRFAHTPEYSI
jgi:Rrf2 family protein